MNSISDEGAECIMDSLNRYVVSWSTFYVFISFSSWIDLIEIHWTESQGKQNFRWRGSIPIGSFQWEASLCIFFVLKFFIRKEFAFHLDFRRSKSWTLKTIQSVLSVFDIFREFTKKDPYEQRKFDYSISNSFHFFR